MKAPTRSGSDAVRAPGERKRSDHKDHRLIPPLGVATRSPVDRGLDRQIYPITVPAHNTFWRQAGGGHRTHTPKRTGLTEEEWQRSVGPYISEVIAAGEHPMLARRVLEAEELAPDVEFAFGLDCVLDGLVARLGR